MSLNNYLYWKKKLIEYLVAKLKVTADLAEKIYTQSNIKLSVVHKSELKENNYFIDFDSEIDLNNSASAVLKLKDLDDLYLETKYQKPSSNSAVAKILGSEHFINLEYTEPDGFSAASVKIEPKDQSIESKSEIIGNTSSSYVLKLNLDNFIESINSVNLESFDSNSVIKLYADNIVETNSKLDIIFPIIVSLNINNDINVDSNLDLNTDLGKNLPSNSFISAESNINIIIAWRAKLNDYDNVNLEKLGEYSLKDSHFTWENKYN